VLGGVLYSGVDTLLHGRVPWTFRHHKKGEVRLLSLFFFSFHHRRRSMLIFVFHFFLKLFLWDVIQSDAARQRHLNTMPT
jgi:hypothetical protein